MLDLRRAHALSADSVRAVQVRVARGGLDALLARLPANGLEGKFSLPYGIASALVDGAVTFPSFSADAFARTSVQQLMRRVEVAEDTGPAVPRWAEVIVRSIDGTERVARCEILRGSAQCPPSDDEVAAKVVDCFDHGGLGKEMAQHLLAFARDLGEAGGAAASDPNAPSAGWLDAFVPRR